MTPIQISHYTLTRKLGAGTYGEVYEAVHQHDPELRVAIKIVAPALVQDPQFVDALKRECRQLDRLRHPNIVAFRDLLVDGDRVAMVLELLRGQDLHHRLSSGPIPVEAAASVVEAILDGLGHAHAAGVLHRDIKPGNVYWCDDGRVVLLDFGIARAADGTQATKTGHMVGTFDYMAPERLSGSGGTASSDVYAVGLIAWELLRGRAACPEGEVGRKLMWHMVEGVGDPAKIAAALPGCPTWFAEVIAALAAKDPAARPADGSAALALLREKRAGASATQAQPPAARRPPPSTVMGPVAVGSVPPVAVSVPPVSVPPSNTSRSAPPGTVMGPASVPTPSAPPPSPGRSAPPGPGMDPQPAAPPPSAAPTARNFGVRMQEHDEPGAGASGQATLVTASGAEVVDAYAWLIAVTPILIIPGYAVALDELQRFGGAYDEHTGAHYISTYFISFCFALSPGAVVSVILASLDVRRIRRAYEHSTLNPMVAIAPVLYLARRSEQLSKHGPMAIHLPLCFTVYGVLLAAIAEHFSRF